MKRSQLHRSSPEKIIAWRRRSKKLVAVPKPNAELDEARQAVMARSGGWCEANTPDCPPYRHVGVHAHHKRLRSQASGHDPALMLYCCAASHAWIHAHPIEAHARGLIIWTGDDNAG